MPTYQLTSPKTGQRYRVQAGGELSPQDAEAAVNHYDSVYEQNTANKSFAGIGDTLSGIGSMLGGLPTTVPAAYYGVTEGFNRPDQYSPEARAAFDANAAYQQRMQQESQTRLMRGEATSAGDAFRSAGPSLGGTVGSMAAAIPAGMAAGALVGTAIEPGGGTVGGGLIGAAASGIGAALGAGTVAYRMAGQQFLNDAFNALQQQRGGQMTEEEKQQAYNELLPLAQNSALWEAGPEAIGNAASLGAAKIVFGLGKPILTNLAKTALGKAGVKAGVIAGSQAVELGTETATALGQGVTQAQADAYARGDANWQQARSPYDRPGGTLQAFQDIAPATLALGATTLGAGGVVKLATLPFENRTNPNAPTPTPGQLDGQLPGNEAPPANPFEGPIEAPPQPTEDGGFVPPAGPQPVPPEPAPETVDGPVGPQPTQPPGAGAIRPQPGASRVTEEGSIPSTAPQGAERVISTGRPNGAQVSAVIDFVEAADLEPLLLREVGTDQTRDRANNRGSSEQIASIATSPDAQLLGDSPVSSLGAPVVDDVILAGNGRAEGLLQGYRSGGAGIANYRQQIVQQAVAQGRTDVADMKQPVMIRRVTGYVRGDRRSFVTESNPKYATLQETVAEAALLDAEVLGDLSGIEFTQSGQLTSSSLQQVATKLKAAQRGINATTGGKPDVIEGTRRVQLAALAKLATDNGVDVSELSGLLETDTGRRAIAEVTKAAPRLAALDADLGLGDVMLSALRSFSEGARAVSQGIFKNLNEWADNRGQELIRDELSPEAGQILEVMIETVRTPTKLRELFENYLEAATNEQDQRNQAAGTNDIFGDARTNVLGTQILRRELAATTDATPAPAERGSGQSAAPVEQPGAETNLFMRRPSPAIGTRLPADEWQKRIDDIETELEQQGVNIFQLYNPSDAGADILAQEGWQPMPENLAEAYRLRDEAGARELDQSRQAIFGALQQAGFSQAEINRILTYYAIDPSKSDASQQYLAATHTVNTAKQNLNQQAESLAYALAAERGIPFDELKDVNSKTLRDAANAVKVVRAYLGLETSVKTLGPADEGDPFMRRPSPAIGAAAQRARAMMPGAVSSSRFQVLGLGSAYQAASQGQSTQMIPLADVFAAARQQNPALTPEQFQAQVMAEYDAGTVLLEGAGSPQEAQSAGLRIDGTPVGGAVRMMVPPPAGGMTNGEGRMRNAPAEEVLGMAGPATAGPLPSMHSGGYPAGPGPQMQTSPPTPWSGKVQTLHGIRRRLLEAAGLPQAGLRRFTQQALGIYKVKPETVRLQAINDIPVLAHEIGHHVHYRFLSGAQPGQTTTAPDWGGVHDAELMPLGRPTSTPQYTPDQVRKEGVAEFTRLWLTNPAQARASAPGFSKFWETELEAKAPQVAEGMRQSRQMIADYIAMPAMQKAKAQIVFDPAAEITGGGIGDTLRTFYTQMVDTLYPAIRTVRQAAQMDPAQADRAADLIEDMENHRGGWASKASSDVFGQQTDLFGKVMGDGLQTILKDLRPGEATDFSTYLALKRAQELEARGVRSGFEQARLPAAEMKALEARFETMRKKLQKWQKNERNLLVQAGLLDDKSAQAMDAANADYVPFYRLYEKLNNVSFGPEQSKNAGGFVDLNSGIRAMKGSDRAIIDPLQSAMKNAFMFRKIAEQNLIGVKFFDLMREVQGAGKWGEAIAPKMKPTITSHEAIVQKLIDEGIIKDASMLPQNADLTLRMYEAITKPDTKSGEVIVFKDGKRQHWEVKDPLLMQALKHADADAVKLGGFPSWAVKIFTLPTRALRWGATGGPWFAIPNFIRDAVQGGVLSRSSGLGGKGFVPFWDSAKGALEILRQGGAYEQWKQAGGQFAGQVTGTTAFTRMLEDALPKDPLAQRAIQGLADPKAWRTGFRNALDLVGAFGKFTEEATRVGEFMRAKQAGATDLAAANFSKIVSLNFARAGETSRVLNQFVPFFNATVQGLDQLIRAHTDPKQRGATIMKGLLYVTGPSLAVWALGKDDEEIQNLPDERKNLFWNINLKPMAAALGMPDAGFILSIPKPFLLGAMYGTSVERALDYATERDPNGARKAAKNILANTINPFDVMMSIGGIRPVIEATTNHSIWTGRDIVPQGYQYLPPEQQYSVLTSQTARMLGQFTGQSPMMIDHLIRGYFATAGTFGTDAIDYGMAKLALTDVPPPPRKGVMELPILNRFAGSPYASNAFVGRFYEAAKDMEGKLAVMNKQAEQMTSAEQKRWFDKNREEIGHYLRTVDFQTGRTGAGDIRKAQAELSEINAAMKEVQASRTLNPEVKRERMTELARQRNELAEGAYKTLFPAEVRKRHY